MKNSKNILKIINKIPEKSGVYLMKNEKDEIIYIGKAKNLKKRIKSYFQNNKDFKSRTLNLVKNIKEIDFIEVHSETEALILENNLIKENKPKYNILLKDDKTFVYLKIYKTWDFPKLEIVRKKEKDQELYFGPKTSSKNLRESLDFIKKIYPVISCNLKIKEKNKILEIEGSEKYPCLEYQMNRCKAPCIGKISSKDYHLLIKQIINFFKGDYQNILDELKNKMMILAQAQKFEQAAKYRDFIKKIEIFSEKQYITQTKNKNQDIIGFYKEDNQTFISLLEVRKGKLIAKENFKLKNEGSEEEIIKSFLNEYYELSSKIPEEIIIPSKLEELEKIKEWFQQKYQNKTNLIFPLRGTNKKLKDLALVNAKNFAKKSLASFNKQENFIKEAKNDIIKLLNENIKTKKIDFPERMEAYDISHHQGTNIVGGMSVFIDGKKDPKSYRKYQIKTLKEGEIDDFKALSEVLERRLQEIENLLFLKKQKESIYKSKKLKIKDLKELKIKSEKNLIYYGVYQKQKINYLVVFVNLKNNSYELKEILSLNNNILNLKEIFLSLYPELKNKKIWVNSKKTDYTEYGFKKIKTFKTEKEETKLIPEEILKDKKKKGKSFYFLKIPTNNPKSIPQLILIDGGKGQLSSIFKVLKKLNWQENNFKQFYPQKYPNFSGITFLSLAKKEEEIFFINEKTARNFNKNLSGSKLLQQLRDEAHKEANLYRVNRTEKRIFKK